MARLRRRPRRRGRARSTRPPRSSCATWRRPSPRWRWRPCAGATTASSARPSPTPRLTADKRVVRNDIKLAAKIITNLDTKWGLWKTEGEEAKEGEPVMGLASANPLLANITDYLIEEASAEEEEL